jgi:glucose/arabinose dehydrogenase
MPPPTPATFDLVQVATGFTNPEDVQQPKDASGRLFVVEQGGRIQIIHSDGTRASSPFLDITGRSGFTSGGETGLLGLAFHPMYAQNRRFFVNYTRTLGGQLQTVIAEFTASASHADVADPATENILLTVDQPFAKKDFSILDWATAAAAGIQCATGRTSMCCWPRCCGSMWIHRRPRV